MYIFFIYTITYKNEAVFVKDVYITQSNVYVSRINNKLLIKPKFEYNNYEITKNGNYKLYFKNDEFIGYKESYFNKLRDIIDKRIEKVFDYKLRAYAKALLLRDKSYLDEYSLQHIKKASISHIFATSAFHLSLIYMIVIRLLLGLNKRIKEIIALVFISIYVFTLGFSPSILRAYLMILTHTLFKNKFKSENVLLYTFLLTLLINPYQILSVSYILTYLISYVVLVSKYNNILLKSAIIQLVTLPIIYYTFGEFNLISFLVNIVYIPLFMFLIYGLIISLLVNFTILINFLEEYVVILETGLYYISKIEITIIKYNKVYFIFILMLYLIGIFAYIQHIYGLTRRS
ncbi:ComEC/Rec2 family competence protein [Oceanivirga miroungae]|uniref:ComEC/Rec2 family competence protein n=1 Tax=Oceanivirga miroungae TaxID=1130046 RepID=UPI001E4B4A67|nr:ComEC/Rec2 family competence protein [Oceanivirga miroungae]